MSTKEERPCYFRPCEFSSWKDETSCSATCGRGLKKQTRVCKARPLDCFGETSRMTFCEIESCPNWTNWSEWERCSKTCGHGIKVRSRKESATGEIQRDTNQCNLRGCKFIDSRLTILIRLKWFYLNISNLFK